MKTYTEEEIKAAIKRAEKGFVTQCWSIILGHYNIWPDPGCGKFVGVEAQVLKAICFAESSLRNLKPRMDGRSLSYGLCQVKLSTAQLMDKIYKHPVKATPKRLLNPLINAIYAAKIYKYQYIRYHANRSKAIEAYNKGRAISSGTGVYVERVLNYIRENRSKTFLLAERE